MDTNYLVLNSGAGDISSVRPLNCTVLLIFPINTCFMDTYLHRAQSCFLTYTFYAFALLQQNGRHFVTEVGSCPLADKIIAPCLQAAIKKTETFFIDLFHYKLYLKGLNNKQFYSVSYKKIPLIVQV